MNIEGSDQHMISTGKGRTTCSYFYPDGKKDPVLIDPPGRRRLSPQTGLFQGLRVGDLSQLRHLHREAGRFRPEATDHRARLRCEATISNDGKKIVFTSVRNGDLDIYTMNADGTNMKQLTHEVGYDGGPFSRLTAK